MKIGDKVRVKSLDEVLGIEGVDGYIANFMLDYCGKEGFITAGNEDEDYFVVFDEGAWFFKKEWLEKISTTKTIVNPTYDDLKHLFTKTNADQHRDLVNQIHDVYVDKNMKYGDAFAETIEKYGMIAALTRMNDKFNRIEQFILHGFDDSEESLKDSLLDLANYCLMTVMEIDRE